MQEVMGSLPYSMHWVEEEDFDTESCIWFASYDIIDPAAKHFEWFIIELEWSWRSVKSWLRCFGINVTLQSEVGRAQNQQGLLSFKFWPQPPLQHIRFFLDNLMPINFNNFLRTHRTENFPLFNEKRQQISKMLFNAWQPGRLRPICWKTLLKRNNSENICRMAGYTQAGLINLVLKASVEVL